MLKEVQNYYGGVLKSNEDLQTNACCTLESIPEHIKGIISNIHEEVNKRYYGCGITIPDVLEGMKILDIGSGAGRDCYILSKLVGENGSVVGIDVTKEQLEIANLYDGYHRGLYGYSKSNVKFLEADIETLENTPLEESSFDIIVSSCVFNLVTDKPKAFEKAGFSDPRLCKSTPITINNPEAQKKVEGINFFSATYRLFKISGLEDACEDYGQAVVYSGEIENCRESFTFDEHHIFPKGKVMTVCGNTFDMLYHSRFRDYFQFIGNKETHYGIFEGCGTDLPFESPFGFGSDSTSCC